MQEFSLPMSPGEGSFVTNTGDEVGTFGDSPVDVHKDAEEPDENVKLGVGLSTKSVSGRHTKNSPTERLLSPAVHECERPRFGLIAAPPFGTKSRSSIAASRFSIVGGFPIFDSNPAKGDEEFFPTQSRQPRASPRARSQRLTSRAGRPQRLAHTLLE